MDASQDKDIWAKILEAMEDKLQLGLLEQARAVAETKIAGNELHLVVANPDAFEFFQSDLHQQRLMLFARPIVHIEKVTVEYRAPTE